jgi:REP element-mobilizing transposase RayT
MSVKYGTHKSSGIFFLTITCSQWIPLFSQLNAHDVVYNWFDYLKEKGHYIFAYVIMPNHIHCIIGLRENKSGIEKIVSNGKRFMAYEIIKRLEKSNDIKTLLQLSDAVSPSDRKRGKLHQVFEPSFDCKECYSDAFILQKLDYIHNNPVRGKWQLVETPAEYVYSSASYYAKGEIGIYPVMHLNERNDLDFGSLE